jgi:hypothetical protein
LAKIAGVVLIGNSGRTTGVGPVVSRILPRIVAKSELEGFARSAAFFQHQQHDRAQVLRSLKTS